MDQVKNEMNNESMFECETMRMDGVWTSWSDVFDSLFSWLHYTALSVSNLWS